MDNLICHSGMLLGSILTLAFVIASVGGLSLLAVSVLRRTSRRAAVAPVAAGRPTAKESLQTQYARGDVTREQYEARKQKLETDKGAESRKGASQ